MRGYNADTLLRLARCDLTKSVALEQFLKSCNRAPYERYQIATPGPVLEAAFAGAGIFAFVFMFAMSSGGWAGCGFVIALVALAVMGLICMAVSDLRILRSVRRARAGRCAVCNYLIDAAPPPGAIACIATCPECGEEVIAGRATDGHGTVARAGEVIATPD